MNLTYKHAFVAIALGSILSSCVPVDEHGRPLRRQPAPGAQTKPKTPEQKVTDTKQQEIDKQRAEMRRRDEARKRAERSREDREDREESPGGGDKPEIKKPEPTTPKPANRPVAAAVPGKPGFVFSPFNNKVVDVKGIPSGTLVADPQYPSSEKKHFRVP